ncbi:hypothetical protein LshimejAT787_0110600 [Lyophyllum shimeji]|uniref:Uncharacterized protein n=1 Tax=Lyophyllum shimeji TaxID=47721 RepID=A0A9P3PE22_LYOSH|nr:hypothetical protein LshimejAT787_0110600 [Lyophyllum shimeji]
MSALVNLVPPAGPEGGVPWFRSTIFGLSTNRSRARWTACRRIWQDSNRSSEISYFLALRTAENFRPIHVIADSTVFHNTT